MVAEGKVSAPVVAGNRIVYGLRHLRSPVELWSVNPDGTDARPVTSINQDRLAGVRMGEPEQFSFAGWNDETVHAYVVKPVDFDPKKKYPVAFLIHGGPQGSFGNDFHYRWNPQFYAGAGYAAVMVDFHGSTGYGQAFTDSIRDDWGGKPFTDLAGRPRRGSRPIPVDGRGPRGRPRRLVRRLHDQLDRRQLAGPVPLPRQSRRQHRRANGLLRHGRTLVPRMGAARPAVGEPRRVPTAQSHRLRRCMENPHARDPRRPRLPRGSTRRASRRSPPCNGKAYRPACSITRTRTTGCSSRPTASCGTRRC